MTSRFESWNGEVLCKNVSLIDADPSVEENTILFMRPISYKKGLYSKWNNSVSQTRFQAHDQPIRSIERRSASVEEQTILIMEAQDHMKKRPFQNGTTRSERLDFRPMTSRFESWNGEVLCKNVSLIDAGPSVEENTILFMEAQDRIKKRPLFKMA
ncbi:hypothetical protein Tco_0958660 [Tanacetum coccineum]